MPTDLQTRPENEQRISTPATRRRFVLRALLALLLLAAVSLPILPQVVASGYEPLRPGSGFFGYSVEGVRQGALDVRPTFESEPDEIVILPFTDGVAVRFHVPLLNDGRWGIDVRGFDFPRSPEYHVILQPVGVRVGDRPNDETRPEHTRPFRPFELPAGETVLVQVEYRFQCQRYVGRQVIDTLPVRFAVFGAERVQEVVLPWRLVTGWQTREDCGFPKNRFATG